MERHAALQALGWGEPFASSFAPYAEQDLIPGRVGVEHRNRYLVHDGEHDLDARLSGKLRLHLKRTGDRPVVGDWVAMRTGRAGQATIQVRLTRKSHISRKVAGRTNEEQVLAANIDTVFLTTALTGDVNARRLERYLLLAWESGAQPVILLSKGDMIDDPSGGRADVERVAKGVPVHVISGRTGVGLDALQPYLQPGETIAVLGSSGVGKST
ncbi:MAG: GTPase RsgA, partial [Longimicrobiales bacterium]